MKLRNLIEKYTAILQKRFAEKNSTGWLMLQQLIIAPLSFISTFLLTNILSIDDYGMYAYILSVSGMVTIASFNGFSDVANINVQKGKLEFYLIAFKYKKILRWTPSLILLGLALFNFYYENYLLGALFLSNILLHLLSDIYNVYGIGCLAFEDYKLKTIIDVIVYFASFFSPILVVYIFRDTPFVLVFFFTSMYLIQLILKFFAFHYVKKLYGFDKYKDCKKHEALYDGNYKKESFRYSLNSVITTVGNNISSIVLFHTIGQEGTAVYNLSTTFANIIQGFLSAPITKQFYLLSKMSENNYSNLEKANYIKSTFIYYLKFTIPIMIISMIAIPFVYYYFFNKYFDNYLYAVFYLVSLLAVIFAPSFQFYLEKKQFKLTNIINLLMLIFGTLLLVVFSHFFGVLGAISVAILTKFINVFIYTYLLHKEK